MPKEIKANAVERSRRIDLVVDMLLKGQTRQSVVAVMLSKYGLTMSMSDKYLKVARDRIFEASAPISSYQISLAIMRYDQLFYRSYLDRNWRACALMQNSIDKLLGLNAPVRIDTSAGGVNSRPVDLSVFSDEEKELLAKLSKKLG